MKVSVKCEHCEKQTVPRRYAHRFCNNACAHAAKSENARINRPRLTCMHCGSKFPQRELTKTNEKYCNTQCQEAARKDARARPCVICGAIYTHDKRVQTCSSACFSRLQSVRRSSCRKIVSDEQYVNGVRYVKTHWFRTRYNLPPGFRAHKQDRFIGPSRRRLYAFDDLLRHVLPLEGQSTQGADGFYGSAAKQQYRQRVWQFFWSVFLRSKKEMNGRILLLPSAACSEVDTALAGGFTADNLLFCEKDPTAAKIIAEKYPLIPLFVGDVGDVPADYNIVGAHLDFCGPLCDSLICSITKIAEGAPKAVVVNVLKGREPKTQLRRRATALRDGDVREDMLRMVGLGRLIRSGEYRNSRSLMQWAMFRRKNYSLTDMQ